MRPLIGTAGLICGGRRRGHPRSPRASAGCSSMRACGASGRTYGSGPWPGGHAPRPRLRRVRESGRPDGGRKQRGPATALVARPPSGRPDSNRRPPEPHSWYPPPVGPLNACDSRRSALPAPTHANQLVCCDAGQNSCQIGENSCHSGTAGHRVVSSRKWVGPSKLSAVRHRSSVPTRNVPEFFRGSKGTQARPGPRGFVVERVRRSAWFGPRSPATVGSGGRESSSGA